MYSPVRKYCFDIEKLRAKGEDFAVPYAGGWSWRLEAGNHCHTFQKALMKNLGFDKVKVIK